MHTNTSYIIFVSNTFTGVQMNHWRQPCLALWMSSFCQVVFVVASTIAIVVINFAKVTEISFIETHIQKVAKVTIVTACPAHLCHNIRGMTVNILSIDTAVIRLNQIMKTIVKPLPLPWGTTARTSSTEVIVSFSPMHSYSETIIAKNSLNKDNTQHTSYQLHCISDNISLIYHK